MYRLLTICLILSAVIFINSESSATESVKTNEIIIVENDWPPFFFGRTQNELPGFAKEVLTTCVSEIGYKPIFKFFPIKRMFVYLESGEVDLAIFSYKKKRESFLHYGKTPLFTSSYRPVVKKDSEIDIKNLQDFNNLRLGHLAGLSYSPEYLKYIENRRKDGTLITTTTGESNLKMLLEGIIDIYVGTREPELWHAKQSGTLDQIKILDFDIKTSEYFVTASRKSPRIASKDEFLDLLDQCLQSLQSTTQYHDIAIQYGIQ